MPLLKYRDYYKPFEYEWAYDAYKTQQRIHWMPEEVHLNDDLRDWNDKLTESERSLLTQIFRFFTQADIDVSSGYIDNYMPAIKPPEMRMMMASFASQEAIHIDSYSLLIDTIGMPETEYQAFHEFQEMSDKHDYLWRTKPPKLKHPRKHEWQSEEYQRKLEIWSLALDLAKFSAFSEGLQLFSSFAILLNFKRFGKMNNMGQIIAWSVRDETLHVESMIKTFRTLLSEEPWLKETNIESVVQDTAREMVMLEEKFIDLVFSHGGVEGLTPEETKEYVFYIADIRLNQLGFKPIFGVTENPLPWVHWMITGNEHQNFFEGRSTAYSKASFSGNWGDAFTDLNMFYKQEGVV